MGRNARASRARAHERGLEQMLLNLSLHKRASTRHVVRCEEVTGKPTAEEASNETLGDNSCVLAREEVLAGDAHAKEGLHRKFWPVCSSPPLLFAFPVSPHGALYPLGGCLPGDSAEMKLELCALDRQFVSMAFD
eukprot:CAMPEP_0202110268 /NCGR_PEP_ID=MMETSP0965-20130614/26155_1 /ASSEMBLY_ACC=CAM_ASM_000507 /TAXON_ID=4773 /ORGANISM="Schizochytrium aggregatum, Strain ATCC28209" /LENGTH=134 /DNA_ID=CAMNT_0048679671 /DNA_START=61 /DNA_END=462 /DNA_ORIENTATION=+